MRDKLGKREATPNEINGTRPQSRCLTPRTQELGRRLRGKPGDPGPNESEVCSDVTNLTCRLYFEDARRIDGGQRPLDRMGEGVSTQGNHD